LSLYRTERAQDRVNLPSYVVCSLDTSSLARHARAASNGVVQNAGPTLFGADIPHRCAWRKAVGSRGLGCSGSFTRRRRGGVTVGAVLRGSYSPPGVGCGGSLA